MSTTYDIEDAFVLVIAAPSITDPVLDTIHKGPFTSIREAQRFARAWRESNGVPGHTNDDPTPEENEAWTDEGWVFGIFKLDTDGIEPTLARELCPVCYQRDNCGDCDHSEATEFTNVHVLLDTGDEFIVEVEEDVHEAMKSVDRRITEGEPIGARKIGISVRQDSMYLIPPHRVTSIGARA